jgi:hypothetical protein
MCTAYRRCAVKKYLLKKKFSHVKLVFLVFVTLDAATRVINKGEPDDEKNFFPLMQNEKLICNLYSSLFLYSSSSNIQMIFYNQIKRILKNNAKGLKKLDGKKSPPKRKKS